MVVDDDVGSIYTIKRGLEEKDEYEVTSVTSCVECIDLLKHNKIPDLILFDSALPEMNGWSTYNKLKDNDKWKNIPVLFLTARTNRIAKDVGDLNGNGYIEKPFKVPELKERIEKILEK